MHTRAEEAGDTAADAADARVPVAAVLRDGARLLASLRKAATALLALVLAEAQVSIASAMLVLLAYVAMVAFAVALWACVVALLGWALALAMHSIGAALAVLVGIHVLLVGTMYFLIRRLLRRAAFPHSRAEFGALRHTLRKDLAKFQASTEAPAAEPPA